jgi:heat shock protein HtpX
MNYMKTAVLLAALAALLIFIGDMLGGRQGALIGLIFAGVFNFGTYWFSDKIVLKMYRAKRVEEKDAPKLYGIVRDLSMKANLPMPKVYIMNTDTPNAFATGRNPKHSAVAVTTGIMKLLSSEELTGVIGHELSHIQNRDILISTIAATIAGAISYLSHMAMWFSLFGGRGNRGTHPAVLIFMMILAPLAAAIIQMAISRSREYGADDGGARISGNPLYLSEALKKLAYYNKKVPLQGANEATAHMFIVNPLKGDSLLKLFSTHPPIEERVKRLEAKLGYR